MFVVCIWRYSLEVQACMLRGVIITFNDSLILPPFGTSYSWYIIKRGMTSDADRNRTSHKMRISFTTGVQSAFYYHTVLDYWKK